MVKIIDFTQYRNKKNLVTESSKEEQKVVPITKNTKYVGPPKPVKYKVNFDETMRYQWIKTNPPGVFAEIDDSDLPFPFPPSDSPLIA